MAALMSSAKLRRCISTPIPAVAWLNSATTAPTRAVVMAILKPAKIIGSAAGRRSFQNTCAAGAPMERNISSVSSSVRVRAISVFTKIGKKQTMAPRAILD